MKKEQKDSNKYFENYEDFIKNKNGGGKIKVSGGGSNGTGNQETNFVRVADDYYEIIIEPRRFGPRETIQHRKKPELRQDKGGHFIGEIPKFSKFIIKPDNVNYKREHGKFFNLYNPFGHLPIEGSTKVTELFLRHVFGDQYELGLEYFKVLYERPWQILPVLVLVSKLRNTGKSTFFNWLSMIFGDNMVTLDPNDLSSQFTDIYATKNILGVDETVIDKRNTIERIKRISTAKEMTVNPKYISQYTVDFYGKIILATNSEKNFMKVDQEEIRFWVRKLPRIAKENPLIENDLKKEIPAFLWMLKNREWLYPVKASRMHFPIDVLDNEELRAVKEESHTGLYKELEEHFADWFYNNEGDIVATATEIKKEYFSGNNQVSIAWIRKVLKEEFELEAGDKVRYFCSFGAGLNKVQQRPFTIKRKMLGIDEEKERKPPF